MIRRFSAVVTQDGPLFVAQCLDVDVASQGETADEALANLREALELYFEDASAIAKAPRVIQVEVEVPASA